MFIGLKINFKNSRKGFTLIEILVAIAIIGVLSSIVLASLNTARAKARDARRKSDLNQIRNALQMYYSDHGNFIEAGSNCGQNDDGHGWFNVHDNSTYFYGPKSIAQCLIDGGYTNQEIIDPTGGLASTPTSGFAYYKANCGGVPSKVYIYAKLETLPQSSTATDGTCSPASDTNQGMNYYLLIQ